MRPDLMWRLDTIPIRLLVALAKKSASPSGAGLGPRLASLVGARGAAALADRCAQIGLGLYAPATALIIVEKTGSVS